MADEADFYPLVETLNGAVTPVEPDDTMAEAGRKILLVDFIKMLNNENGSRTGDDIEHVHDMRVATRRMRSAFRLLESYYKPGTIRPLMENLKQVAKQLGAIRDLDVMIEDLEKAAAASLPADQPAEAGDLETSVSETDAEASASETDTSQTAPLQAVIDRLDKKRRKARKKLVNLLDSSDYTDFVQEFTGFLTRPGAGAKHIDEKVITPYQVRHVLPTLLHEHLAAVRAYDTVIATAAPATLHALRIEFKRLRYAVSFFRDVLGNSGEEFVNEIKTLQDHLGRMNDMTVAREHLHALIDDEEIDAGVLQDYMDQLQAATESLEASFPTVWQRFNTRTVQSKLSNALLALR